MKTLLMIAATCVAACLFSCRPQKSVTNINRDNILSYTDTTTTETDTTGLKQTNTDTTKTAVNYEGGGVIEFVEGGGKVCINSAGNVTFEGIKTIKGQHKENISQDKGVTRTVEETVGHREWLNSVKAGQTQREKRSEEKTSAQKWYETALARLGLGVCIAVLMWLISLYLKRKF